MYTPYKMMGSTLYGKAAVKNLGFIKAKTLEKNPNAKTMEVDGKTFPINKKYDNTMAKMAHKAPTTKKGCKSKYRK